MTPEEKKKEDEAKALKLQEEIAKELQGSIKLTVKRLGETPNRQNSYSYQIVKGLRPEIKAKVQLYGRTAGMEDSIMYSLKRKGASVGVEFEVDVRIIEPRTAGAKMQVVFARTSEEIRETLERVEVRGRFYKNTAPTPTNGRPLRDADKALNNALAAVTARMLMGAPVEQTTEE